MSYPKEIYLRAEKILAQRREDSAMDAHYRLEEIMEKLPEIQEIQKQLSAIGIEISTLFLHQGGDMQQKVNELRQKSEALVAKRAAVLKSNGYGENAMSQIHICPACEDKGFVGGKICACHRQLLKDLMHKELKKTAPVDDCTFDNFSLDYYSQTPLDNSVVPYNKAKAVFDACRRYAQNFNLDSKNLLFMGGTGLGKTHLSLAIANVAVNRGYWVCYGTSQNICDDMQAEQFGRGDDCYYNKNKVFNCDLLIIDDLGTEIANQYSVATIYNIINTRMLAKKPTIISTNYAFEQLQDKYDQRITSRINGEYVAFYLVGNDIRNIK